MNIRMTKRFRVIFFVIVQSIRAISLLLIAFHNVPISLKILAVALLVFFWSAAIVPVGGSK